jgi:hypothetical protein
MKENEEEKNGEKSLHSHPLTEQIILLHKTKTGLCELSPSDLDPTYRAQMAGLRTLVRTLARPKIVDGRPARGPELAALLRRVIDALNSREIPSANAVLSHFNSEVQRRCTDQYEAEMAGVALPADVEDLARAHEAALRAAVGRFLQERFRSPREEANDALEQELRAQLHKVHTRLLEKNALVSGTICEEGEGRCESVFDSLDRMRLPTEKKFEHEFGACEAEFLAACVGPARERNIKRLEKRHERELGLFRKGYNQRIQVREKGVSLENRVV